MITTFTVFGIIIFFLGGIYLTVIGYAATLWFSEYEFPKKLCMVIWWAVPIAYWHWLWTVLSSMFTISWN